LVCLAKIAFAAPALEKNDLGNILNMLPGGATSGALNMLAHLTSGTNLNQAFTLLQLLNNIHQLEGNIQSIPQDFLHALNSTAGLISNSINNLTSIVGTGKRGLLKIYYIEFLVH
jgi:hypothetical protein